MWYGKRSSTGDGEATLPKRRKILTPVLHRAALLLATAPTLLRPTEDQLSAWKEVAPLIQACRLLPFITEGWQEEAAPQWWTWVEMVLHYAAVMGRLPPSWVNNQWGFRDLQEVRVPAPEEEWLQAYVKGLRYGLEPILLAMGLPVAPVGIHSESPTILLDMPMVAWRASPQALQRHRCQLHAWYPRGLRAVQDLRVCQKPPLAPQAVPAADASLFSPGHAAPVPWKKPRRR